ncbi:hypothetical protein [Streptomyces sp. NPDC101249]|uniref:hypothetical protein n=1 Tax=Streptomyces sp. NPDC101249 TaxID=3366140 RepID=UPI00380FC8CC
MTSSLIRGRPRRRAPSLLSARLLHTVLGGLAGVVWLVLPGVTTDSATPVPPVPATTAPASGAATPPGPVPSPVPGPASVPSAEGTSTADLALPLVVLVAALVLGGYGYLRRTRRARTRTTPGGTAAVATAPPPQAETDERARALLVAADDWVRVGREELDFAGARLGATAVEPFARAVREAAAELSAACRMRRRHDEGPPGDREARRHLLAGIVGRCEEAGRRLDADAAAFDRLRGLDPGSAPGVVDALVVAETRFRALAGHTGRVAERLARLGGRYGGTVTEPVTGYVEQAKDRLVFTTFRLNEARQAADRGERDRAARHLRSAEGGIAQAAAFLDGVERLAADLESAERLLPATLTGAEAEIAGARGTARENAEAARGDGAEPPVTARGHRFVRPGGSGARPAQPLLPADTLLARADVADAVLAAVRTAATAGPFDPVDALRRVTVAVLPLAAGRAGAVPAAASLVAAHSVADADTFVGTHRGAVGHEARTLLSEAARSLADDPLAADAAAVRARALAERDVRGYGNPLTGESGHESGLAGAVLGGVLLPPPDGSGPDDVGPPPSFGGPRTFRRRAPEPL